MISIDKVLLLEQKVESAVEKISELQKENDALRTKCSELTNALSEKSELLSSFEQDQNKIESGILKALDRLNSIENSVLKAGGVASPTQNVQNITSDVQPSSPITENITTSNIEAETKTADVSNTTDSTDANGQFDIF